MPIVVLQVFYVVLQFYSPQPSIVTIEKRTSPDAEWRRWQLYAEDCITAFGLPNNGPLVEPDSVNCIQYVQHAHKSPLKLGYSPMLTPHILYLP